MNTQSANSFLDRFFQLGYVVRDLDKAMASYNRRFGPAEFQVAIAEPEYPHTRRVAMVYQGPVMIELIEPNPEVPSIYVDYIPEDDSGIRFHHTGHLVDDYQETLRRLAAEGYNTPYKLSYGDVNDCCYTDMRAELGHYVEHVRLGEPGKQWFSSIPGFTAFP